MLNHELITLLNRVTTALINHGENSLAAEVSEALTTAASARAAMSAAAKARKGKARRGAPKLDYRVAVEPGWAHTVQGAKAAHRAVEAELDKHGQARTLPKLASIASTLGKQGSWTTLAETDNGVISISITKLA